MGMPQHTSIYDSYGMEMLWSLGHLFRDKYNADCQSMFSRTNQSDSFYSICCTIWSNLKSNHCYQLQDACHDPMAKKWTGSVRESSQSKTVAFAILTPHRIEYQPMHSTLGHRGFELYAAENWLLVHMRDYDGKDKIMALNDHTRVHFKKCMIKGIDRDKRQFRYFGSSGSQMNDQAGWFLALPPGESMDTARGKLGNLSDIKSVATYISRVGLYLTASKSTQIKLLYRGMISADEGPNFWQRTTKRLSKLLGLSARQRESTDHTAQIIPDVERGGFCFTDGCGMISLGLAEKVARSIGIRIREKVSRL